MATLVETLPLPDRRDEIVDACCRLLDDEVKRKGGLSGLAIKTGYKVMTSFKAGAVRGAVDGLLDDFLEALEPFHADFEAAGTGTFGGVMKSRAGEVAEALVGVTDRRANSTPHQSLAGAYRKLRSNAVRNVQEAVPGLADLMDRFYQG